ICSTGTTRLSAASSGGSAAASSTRQGMECSHPSRDFAAKEVAFRGGEPEQIVWQTTYAKSQRARQQRALHHLPRPNQAHQRSRFHRWLVGAIATQVKEIRGTWPSYSSAFEYGCKDVLKIQDWLNWLFCPRHSSLDKVGNEIIVKRLKAQCRR